MPVYEEPERPGWKRTALGIGLSGVANLAGQGPFAAQQFFLAPEARAEREYARELGAYSARQGEWSDYYDQVLAATGVDIRQQQLEQAEREQEWRERQPVTVPYRGTLYDPTAAPGEGVLYQDPRAPYGDTQWGAEREQAIAYWLQAHPGRTRESMTAFELDEAIEGRRRRRGEEVLVPGFHPETGRLVYRPRGEMIGEERPAAYYDEQGNLIYQYGTTPERPRAPTVTPDDIAREERFADEAKRQVRLAYQRIRNQPLAPRPGTARYIQMQQEEQAELDQIDADLAQRLEGLRSGSIAPRDEDRVLQYNPATGRAE